MKIIIHILSNALAIYLAAKYVPGIDLEVSFKNLIIASALLGLVNAFVKPLIKLLSFPVIILTLGLFVVIINIAMLMLVAWLLPTFTIASFAAAFWGVVIISITNYLISALIKNKD